MRLILASVVVLALVPACSHGEEHYESVVQVVRKDAVEKTGEDVTTLDLEVEWDPCPGDQFQVIRGGKEFADCAKGYEVGDFLPVQVKRFWDVRGYYRWDIEKIGECSRSIEPSSYGSYEKSAECKDVVNHGRTIGFECSRKPFRDLVRRCPWMARD